jgi:DNA-binding HxlR family transcriptional regulator
MVGDAIVSLIFKLVVPNLAPVTNQADRRRCVITLAELPGRPCPIAAGLEVVGDRWSLLVVRELSLGATRFTEIVAGTGAPRDRIAARLRALVDAGVVSKVAYQSAPPRFDYRLTTAGQALLPVLDSLLVWGKQYAVAPDDPDRDRHHTLRPLEAR